jgi:hypothetical protein
MSSIHEPYELTKMDLKELQATVKQDSTERFYADIQNPAFKNKLISPHLWSIEELRIILKLRMYYFKLKSGVIRYCKECDHNLILDKRPFVDVCDDCLKGDKQ